MLGTLAFLPGVVFLRVAQWNGPPSDERWMLAFQVATPFAGAYLLVAFCRRRPANRLVTATNLYLLAGGVMSFLRFWPGLAWYGQFRESAVMLIVVLVGLFTSTFTRAGFIGLEHAEPRQPRRDSLLLAAAVIALVVAWFGRGNPFWAVVLPMMLLSLLGHHLKMHHARNISSPRERADEPA